MKEENIQPFSKERYDEICQNANKMGYAIITKWRKGVKFLRVGKSIDKPYCTCTDSHLSCPEGIDTCRCVYCGKPSYAVYQKIQDGKKQYCDECKTIKKESREQ
jgi:hypothetical protein